MSNLSMGLCGKLAKSVSWSTFAPLDSDLSYVTTSIFCEFVSCPNKPNEHWYWSVEISYTQAFSRCLISPCSSFFDFHFYYNNSNNDNLNKSQKF